MELLTSSTIFPSYPRLRLAVFIANVFHKTAEVSVGNCRGVCWLLPRLRLATFIANVFHTIAGISGIVFNLRRQFLANAKAFELEGLWLL